MFVFCTVIQVAKYDIVWGHLHAEEKREIEIKAV